MKHFFAIPVFPHELIGKYRKPVLNGIPDPPWEGILDNYFTIAAISDPPLWTSAVAASKKSLLAVHGFPVGVSLGEDLLTWARLAAKFNIAYVSIPLATYRLGYTGYQTPTKSPDIPDQVGTALKHLLEGYPSGDHIGLNKYLALWHKHRASMYLRLGQRGRTLIEVIKMGRYSIDNKFFLYLGCIIMPTKLVLALISKYQKIAYAGLTSSQDGL